MGGGKFGVDMNANLLNSDLANVSDRVSHPGRKLFFENQLLTYKQAAQYLSLSEPYLRKLKAREEIPYVVVGSRAVRFRVCSLDQWIENREVK